MLNISGYPEIDRADYLNIKAGKDIVLSSGAIIPNSELTITGTLIRSSDPIMITYDLMVIISGMVIIGFSMGFTLRKPKILFHLVLLSTNTLITLVLQKITFAEVENLVTNNI